MSSALSTSPSRQAPLIAVDVRMWGESGIGRYLREVLPRVVALWPEARWRLFGHQRDWGELPAVEKVSWEWPVYGWKEHCWSTPREWHEADVRWVPHYNVTADTRAPLLVTVHDVLPLVQRSGWRGRLRAGVAKLYFGRVRRRAGCVVSPSRFSAEGAVAMGRIEATRARVTPLGVDEAFHRANDSDMRREAVWLFVGNVKPHKGLATLLDALERLSEAGLSHQLVIVGRRDGFFTAAPQLASRASLLGDRVQWAGEVSEAELCRWYRTAEALVMPSTHEGFGLPVLEAMAAGCPVVAARAGAVPEVAGDSALWFDAGDVEGLAGQLTTLAGDARLRARLAALGTERAKRFDWWVTAEMTIEALKKAWKETV